ncbi:MAG: ethyl tert-butyl ether degradation protein EthD [Salinicola sp.]|nr:ethyl tert-butyl ether degradation protein EthD [Salinicola sp.]
MTKMMVVCVGDENTRFDREYYATQHLALAMECWGQYGLEAAEAFYPAGNGDGWLSIGVYRFREASDIDVALASPETELVMADVKKFTDATVVMRSLFSPL